MGLLEKMAARREQPKAWAEPPFWEQPPASWFPMASYSSDRERIGSDYPSYIDGAFKANPAVFACIRFRMSVLSEARFRWRQMRNGSPGDLFGTPDLGLLEQPWPGGTTSDLLTRMEVTASLAGNYYATVADTRGRVGRAARGDRFIANMRPDWTTIVVSSASGDPNALDARVVGYLYAPISVNGQGEEPITLLPDEVVHFAPIPDPAARFRGMSWLTPILPEVQADKAATRHQGRFFENGATPAMKITSPQNLKGEQLKRYVADFRDAHQGADNAYKTLFLFGGSDASAMSANFQQMDFKALRAQSEVRIAEAAGVHPTLVGMSEGLQGSSLNTGNFHAAKRLFATATARPWWRNAAESWQSILTPPAGAELWYDDRDIKFLQDDGTDEAAIRVQNATTLRSLIDGGYEPDAAVDYLLTNDLSRLVGHHTGMRSVQLYPAGQSEPRPGASSNGTRNGSEVAVPR